MKAIIFLYNFTVILTGLFVFLCYFLIFEGKNRNNGYFQNRISFIDENSKIRIKNNKFSTKKISLFFIVFFFILTYYSKKEWIV